MQIKGNIDGVKKNCLAELEALGSLAPAGRVPASEELCLAMLAFTHKYNREIAVYLDNRGKVTDISLGDANTVQLGEVERRNARVRCLHTHPGGNAHLSAPDITAAQKNGLTAIACLALDEDGAFGGAELLLQGDPEPLYFSNMQEFCSFELPQRQSLEESREEQREQALLISLSCGRRSAEVENSLAELASLAETAGIEVLHSYIQNADKPVAATYIGRGKAEFLRMEAQVYGCSLLIFDDEISPTQLHNLETLTGLRIIDRTMLILDIFASRARSNEGKLQVELAQLKYMLPRLTGRGTALSRLGGGIGTRGPGETKLETDRRKIHIRIAELESKLEKVERERSLRRSSRESGGIPTVALVGYTNAGKTTLLNRLSGAESFSADLLFATLDTLTRRVEPASGQAYLLSDTVGFIRRLPHQLIAAFRATLGELRYADLLLHVIDASSPEAEAQAEAVQRVLAELGLTEKPVITVLNKCDAAPQGSGLIELKFPQAVHISAAYDIGLNNLQREIASALERQNSMIRCTVLLPYARAALLDMIHKSAEVTETAYEEEHIRLKLIATQELYGKLISLRVECLTEGKE